MRKDRGESSKPARPRLPAESSKKQRLPAATTRKEPATWTLTEHTGRHRLVAPALPEAERTAGLVAATPAFNAAAVMHPLQKNLAGENATSDSLMAAVADQVQRVQAGDLAEVEAMLVSQAMSLQTLYASLARRAVHQEYLTQYQAFMGLALKAQAQSRATLEALIELKHPRHPATFVKQANIAHGPQQVNNGSFESSTRAGAPAGNRPAAPSKLLEVPHEEQDRLGLGGAADRVAVRGADPG